jgi:hypothetical protein
VGKNAIKFKTYPKTERGLEVSDVQFNPFVFIGNIRRVISSEGYSAHPFAGATLCTRLKWVWQSAEN